MNSQQLGIGLIIGLLLGAGGIYLTSSQPNAELEDLRQQYEVISAEYQELQDTYVELENSFHDLEKNVEDMVLESEYNLLEQELSQSNARIDTLRNQIDRHNEAERILEVELNLYQWLYRRAQGEREWRARIIELYGFNWGFTYIAAVTGISLLPAFFIQEPRNSETPLTQ